MPTVKRDGRAARAIYAPGEVQGWPSHTIELRAEVVDGLPRVTALSITPEPGAKPVGLTSVRLRSLRLIELATTALGMLHTSYVPELPRAVRRLTSAEPVKHDQRAATTVEQVAAAWWDARRLAKAPRKHIVAVLGINARTADRYLAKARDGGLIEPIAGARAPKTPDAE